MSARVRSVNVGPTVDVPWGNLKRSAIDKRPVEGPVQVGALGLVGDEIADQVFHGGLDQAVYAYAREDLDDWADELGREIRDGAFGENLTTTGLDVQGALMGDRWAIGSTLLEVCGVRIPCSVFQGFLDERRWVKRFTAKGVPGAYLRVVTGGVVRAGDEVVIAERRGHHLTVGHTFRALTTERSLLRGFVDEPRLADKVLAKVDAARNDSRR